jgi:superfamily II DNA/RNA helicase
MRSLFDAEVVTNGIIFCNRKKDIGDLLKSLHQHNYKAVSLHGDMDQHMRLRMLDQFKNGEATYLIASDVAARGLDIPAVSHVFNFDVPTHAEDYVHRIGRTGRAGRSGAAFTLATRNDAKYVEAIEKLIEQPIPRTAFEGGSGEADAPASKRSKPKRDTQKRDDKPKAETVAPTDSAEAGKNQRRGLLGRGRKKPVEENQKADAAPKEAPQKSAPKETAKAKPNKPPKAQPAASKKDAFEGNMPAFLQTPIDKN